MTRLGSIGLLATLCAALVGCEVPASEPPPEPIPEDGACVVPGQSEIRLVEADPPADGCPWEWECGVDEYLDLPQRYPDLVVETTDEELDQVLTQFAEDGFPQESNPGNEEVVDTILSTTRLDAHLEGLAERPLDVSILDEGDDISVWAGDWENGDPPPLHYRQLLVTDPLVGTLEVMVFLPDGEGPFPPVVISHGHGDHPYNFIARQDFGEEFTLAGYALIIPHKRVSNGGDLESYVARGMLLQGFNLMGVRMYEELIGRRIAAWLPEVDPCAPVGLVGHSGGSVSGNLAVHAPVQGLSFDAYVSDLTSGYWSFSNDPHNSYLLDENVPGLWHLAQVINTFIHVDIPVLEVPYGYPDGMDDLLDFFDDTIL